MQRRLRTNEELHRELEDARKDADDLSRLRRDKEVDGRQLGTISTGAEGSDLSEKVDSLKEELERARQRIDEVENKGTNGQTIT